MRTIVLALPLLTLATPSLLAQFGIAVQSPQVLEARAPTATLSGHVICSDTNGPARFARVMLTPVVPPKKLEEVMEALEADMQRYAAQTGQPVAPPSGDELVARRAVALQKARQEAGSAEVNSPAIVGADGTYFFKAVSAGAYYVHAQMPGYWDPFEFLSEDDLTSTDPAIQARVAKAAPTVTINGTESARMDLRIERGAAISGCILYDDGAPAQHWTIYARRRIKQDPPARMLYNFVIDTDDVGRFRLSGLPADEYILAVSFEQSLAHRSFTSVMERPDHVTFVVFSGNTPFESKAQPIAVTAGEERTGADITVPLHNLHRISGRVVAKSNSHPADYGGVELTTADGTDFVASATLYVNGDGNFTLNFIPGNSTYTLKVDAAEVVSTREPNADGVSQTIHKFAPISRQITLRDDDADNIVLEVPEPSVAPEE